MAALQSLRDLHTECRLHDHSSSDVAHRQNGAVDVGWGTLGRMVGPHRLRDVEQSLPASSSAKTDCANALAHRPWSKGELCILEERVGVDFL